MKANLKVRELGADRNAIWDMIIGAAFALIFIITALYIGTFIQGTVGSSLISSMPAGTLGTKATNTLYNLSGYWDTDVGMLNIALVIVIITLPLMALVYVRKIM